MEISLILLCHLHFDICFYDIKEVRLLPQQKLDEVAGRVTTLIVPVGKIL